MNPGTHCRYSENPNVTIWTLFGVKIRYMAKKTTSTRTASVDATPAVPATTTAAPADVAPRLTVQLTKDGRAIDWERLRDSRRDDLRAILANSGIKPAATAAARSEPLLNAAVCSTLFDLLAQVESIVAARAFGCTMAQAFEVLQFSDPEKAMLADPTARVLEKYLPASMLDKYADEILLCMLLGTTTRTKVAKLQESLTRHTSRPEVKTESHKISVEKVVPLREIVAP